MTKPALGIIGAALVAILALGYAGYSAMNPHSITLTQQQFVTNLQRTTTTVTASTTVTSQALQAFTAANGNAYQVNCVPGQVDCNWPYNYDACWGTGQGNNVACDGYLTQDQSGCVELAVPTITDTEPPYNHYTLQNLPYSYPPIGTWVLVKGQLLEGPNSAPNGAACPTSIITVTSIQPTNAPVSP